MRTCELANLRGNSQARCGFRGVCKFARPANFANFFPTGIAAALSDQQEAQWETYVRERGQAMTRQRAGSGGPLRYGTRGRPKRVLCALCGEFLGYVAAGTDRPVMACGEREDADDDPLGAQSARERCRLIRGVVQDWWATDRPSKGD